METLAYVFFGIHVVVIVAGAVAAVAADNLVRALLGLILTLFGVAGMYILLAAPFIALMQILIYVGAVSILVFFAIMLTRPVAAAGGGGDEAKGNPVRKHLNALMAATLPALTIGFVVAAYPPKTAPRPIEADIAALGRGLLEPYVLAFELISVVLFVAMSAAVLLAFKKRGG